MFKVGDIVKLNFDSPDLGKVWDTKSIRDLATKQFASSTFKVTRVGFYVDCVLTDDIFSLTWHFPPEVLLSVVPKKEYPLDGKDAVLTVDYATQLPRGMRGKATANPWSDAYPYFFLPDAVPRVMPPINHLGYLVSASEIEEAPIRSATPTTDMPRTSGWGFSAKQEDIDFDRIAREASSAGFDWLSISIPSLASDGGSAHSIKQDKLKDIEAYLGKVGKSAPSPEGYVVVADSKGEFDNLMTSYREAKNKKHAVRVSGGKID